MYYKNGEEHLGNVISLGWTTPPLLPDEVTVGYGQVELDAMQSLIEKLPSQALITYAVRAKLIFATNMEDFGEKLMNADRFSLSVWTSVLDELESSDLQALVNLRSRFGKHRVFFDLPSKEMADLTELL